MGNDKINEGGDCSAFFICVGNKPLLYNDR